MPAGFRKLDMLTGGFQESAFIVIGARPSVGKTAFALNIAAHASNKDVCLVFSLEMAKKQLLKRATSFLGDISTQKMRNPRKTFEDLSSISRNNVGCLSQFYIKEEYRQYGVGSKLFNMSMKWLKQFDDIEDYFIFVSNGNNSALEFYKRKGFSVSHDILDGFITVLRKNLV
nr:GNAT family N-acetyltransferase [Peribacillus cavernae]